MKILLDVSELCDEQKQLIKKLLYGNKSQVTLNVDNDMELATPSQVKYLRGLKYDGDPGLLTKNEASRKIKELKGEGV